jgi:hypothetical protein
MNTEFEQLKKELQELGFDEAKFSELLDIATEEAIDITVDQLSETLDDQELESMILSVEKPYNSPKEAIETIDLLFKKAYGENAESKKFELINNFLRNTLDIAKKSNDLLTRYQQGDPTAIATIQSHVDDPETKDLQEAIGSSL